MGDQAHIGPDTCDSCGDEAEVVQVRRVYLPLNLDNPSDDPGADAIAADELEWWCEVCRIHYPHHLG